MYTQFERLLSKSLTSLEVMSYYPVVHTGPEWCFSSMICNRDTPFWSETLEYGRWLEPTRVHLVSLPCVPLQARDYLVSDWLSMVLWCDGLKANRPGISWCASQFFSNALMLFKLRTCGYRRFGGRGGGEGGGGGEVASHVAWRHDVSVRALKAVAVMHYDHFCLDWLTFLLRVSPPIPPLSHSLSLPPSLFLPLSPETQLWNSFSVLTQFASNRTASLALWQGVRLESGRPEFDSAFPVDLF